MTRDESRSPHARGEQRDEPWTADLAGLVAEVDDGCQLSVGGFHFTRVPVAALMALLDRGVRHLRYVAWGGGLPLEMLLEFSAVAEATICFSAMDVFGMATRFRRAAEEGSLRLHETTALALMTGLRSKAENLPWDVMQKPAGSSLGQQMSEVESDAVPMVRIPPIPVDVMLLHAQRADDHGNVELAGARGTDLCTLFAARKLLVTVEERVPAGGLGARRAFIIPRSHVHRVALSPGGAHPTSCLPYYSTDFRAIGRFNSATDRASIRRALQPPDRPKPPPNPGALVPAIVRQRRAAPILGWSVAELLATVIARTVDNSSVCSFGSAAPLPAVAYLLAKHTHAPRATLMSFNGGYVDVAARPMSLTFAEPLDFDSAAVHAGGDETYRWYYQAGRVTHEVVGAAQVDSHMATNNLWLTKADGGRVRLPGQGGMADVANLHRNFTIYLPRHSPRNTVPAVEQVSAQRVWRDAATRVAYGLQPGSMRVLTNLCIFEPDADSGELVVTSIHPGVDRTEIEGATGFEVRYAQHCRETPAPTAAELHALRTVVDPLGIRDLDFVAARERDVLIEKILQSEDNARAEAVAGTQDEKEAVGTR